MLFNSLQYAVFFVLVFTLHWILPLRLRRPFLLLASYYFYASAFPQYVFLILALTVSNYVLGLWLARITGRGRRARFVARAQAASAHPRRLGCR